MEKTVEKKIKQTQKNKSAKQCKIDGKKSFARLSKHMLSGGDHRKRSGKTWGFSVQVFENKEDGAE